MKENKDTYLLPHSILRKVPASLLSSCLEISPGKRREGSTESYMCGTVSGSHPREHMVPRAEVGGERTK